ncbi:GDSL esterase/lipase At1g28640 [Capsella rubella]|uniref:GDSL esterase/lipase At1g28640 n=1 Tax=Capsella rubella TaxID=81985 RepID=UPI000CD50AB9|nr:GDSL esterase/lipase At1g28640 [Capsella rubella]
MIKMEVIETMKITLPMTSSLKKLISTFLLILYSTTVTITSSESRCRRYKSIISFGDSSADTGNYLHLSDVNHLPQAAFLPYGESFFHPPSGRYSDGRLIIDFIAEFLGLPYVTSYFGSQNVSFDQGINFAVYGATALDRGFLVEKGIESAFTNVSLSVQLNIFKHILPNLCISSSPDCSREMLGDSLILMGEIGVNDYNYLFFEGKSINDIKELVPLVIKAISSTIVDLIDLGGKTFLVPGNFPIGCYAAYLTLFQTVAEEYYDPFTGCLPWLNEFGEYHNEQLKKELKTLQKLYPHVNIIYADYYNSLYTLYKEPVKHGFRNRPLAACCGVGGQYNFTIDKECGYGGVSYCQNPSEYVNWDGYHLTEATHQTMAQGILNGPYATPSFDWSCFGSESVDKECSFSS